MPGRPAKRPWVAPTAGRLNVGTALRFRQRQGKAVKDGRKVAFAKMWPMPAIEWSLLWHERNKIDQGPNASNAHKMPGICLEKPRPAL